ncbi:hypothetical protein ANN_02215 [Periplaneta americana]|uniref:Reverse transcriptase domain-containing protein n=1 Tax=Periplaneta americana TaxID=6978 RepID=A0ABQ8TYS0_PERAM|nr:hypothetical protein ANN_02215 [Periplaneta americana]
MATTSYRPQPSIVGPSNLCPFSAVVVLGKLNASTHPIPPVSLPIRQTAGHEPCRIGILPNFRQTVSCLLNIAYNTESEDEQVQFNQKSSAFFFARDVIIAPSSSSIPRMSAINPVSTIPGEWALTVSTVINNSLGVGRRANNPITVKKQFVTKPNNKPRNGTDSPARPQQWNKVIGTIKIGDLSFKEVEKFKYLGATVTNINGTREEIKRRINVGNACYHSAEKLLSSSLLSKNLKVRIYKTVILPVVLYGCETWTLTLREEQRLGVFENKVLRKIFGAKRDEVTGEWRKLHNAELHALYSSPDIIRNIKSRHLRWAGHVARMSESRNAYRVFVGGRRKKTFGEAETQMEG